jgi:hypothetical protein
LFTCDHFVNKLFVSHPISFPSMWHTCPQNWIKPLDLFIILLKLRIIYDFSLSNYQTIG